MVSLIINYYIIVFLVPLFYLATKRIAIFFNLKKKHFIVLMTYSLLINLVVQQHNVFLYCVRRLTIMYTMRVMYICAQLMLPRLLIESIYYCCLEN